MAEHDAFGFRELGTARLRDRLVPERLFQGLHSGLNADFPLPLSLDRLLAQIKGFLGRATDLAEVRRLLKERRRVTLVGAAGSGKPRLAIQTVGPRGTDFSLLSRGYPMPCLPVGLGTGYGSMGGPLQMAPVFGRDRAFVVARRTYPLSLPAFLKFQVANFAYGPRTVADEVR